MPKPEKCTKRIVFYLTPSEYERGEQARKRFPQFRNLNAYATSAYFIQIGKDLKARSK